MRVELVVVAAMNEAKNTPVTLNTLDDAVLLILLVLREIYASFVCCSMKLLLDGVRGVGTLDNLPKIEKYGHSTMCSREKDSTQGYFPDLVITCCDR